MPFGLGKSEKRPEDEGAAPEETLGGDEATTSDGPVSGVPDDGSSATAGAPAAEHQAGGGTHVPTFRRDFPDEAAPPEGEAPPPPPPEGDTFFVSVTRDDAAEIHRFDDPAEAQAFVEQLLEKDVPENDVAAFSGRRLALKVSRRPIVKLPGDQED